MSKVMSLVSKCLIVSFVALGVAGCASAKMKRENGDLRTQVQNLSDQLAASQAENDRLAQQLAGTESDLSKVRSDYAAQQSELEAMTKKLSGQGFDVEMRQGMMVVTMPQKILYNSGSAELSSSGKDKLKQLTATLNGELKDYPVQVQGHTDTDPIVRTKDKYKSNWELSYDRAQTVVYYLISLRVDPKRIHAAAFGQYSPVASNASSDGKARNRRVEIVVMQAPGK